jgi:hypothetical protein
MSLTNLVNRMIDNINNNTIMNIGVAAVLMRGTRPVGKICSNSERNYCRGKVCPSIHAEASAMMCHFGKSLSYCPTAGWTKQCLKERKVKCDGGTS